MLCPVENLIPERNIIVFSPHFDDVLFMLGGYILEMKKKDLLRTKRFRIMLMFGRSNYLARTGEGNFDTTLDRLKLATGKRIIEDFECLDEMFGVGGYGYEIAGELECFARGKVFANCEMEFPHGMFADFDAMDHEIYSRIQDKVRLWAAKEDTALVFPLAIKEHIDHFMIREAGAFVASDPNAKRKARFYFQEDKPYGGIAAEAELARTETFISSHILAGMTYAYDSEALISLAFRHYPSQVEDIYRTGICNRARQLGRLEESDKPCDRIFRHP
jgi:hypothetical protein